MHHFCWTPAIQATYDWRNEIEMLPRSAAYFLNRVRSRSVFLVLYFRKKKLKKTNKNDWKTLRFNENDKIREKVNSVKI